MSVTFVHPLPSWGAQALLLFVCVWPFVVLALVSRRSASAAPVAAMLAPLLWSMAAVWLQVANLMELMRRDHRSASVGSEVILAPWMLGEALFALYWERSPHCSRSAWRSFVFIVPVSIG